MQRIGSWLRNLTAQVFPWPLVRIGGPVASAAASAAAVLALAASRLLLFPAGPWEQDEALMACGVVDFDPARHMPLPPGFPLWVAIGKAMRQVGFADPVRALQVASAVLSIAAVWALVGVWDRVAGRGAALAGAALAAFVPGVWFHSGRAFSEMPSAALAVIAFALWMRCGKDGFVPGVAVMTAAALIRPPLAPVFVLTVALAAWWVRREPRRLAAGAAAGAAVLALVTVPAALAAGGWRLLVDVSTVHAGEHFATLGTEPWALARLGFVRGLATTPVAVAFAVLAALGWWTWRRALGGRWWAGTLAGSALLVLVLFMDNRTYPRYFVLVWLLAATPAVAGIGRVVRSRTASVSLACVAGAALGVWTWPAMRYVHRTELPVVALLRTVAAEGHGLLVFEDQLFSFRNVAEESGWLHVDSVRLTELERSARGLSGSPTWLLGEGEGQDLTCSASRIVEASCPEPRVWRLSQERFLRLRLVRNPVLVARGGSFLEWEGTHRFVWCQARTALLAPAVRDSGTLALSVEVHPQLDGLGVSASVNGARTFSASLPAGFRIIPIPIPTPSDSNRPLWINLESDREVRSPGDGRRMAVRIFGASLQAPPHALPALSFLPEAASLFAAFADSEGTYGPELLGDPPRPAAWTGPHAAFTFPAGAGSVGVEMMAPRPQPATVVVRLGDSEARATVGPDPTTVALPVPQALARTGRVRLDLEASTVVPGGGDVRALGVAVSRVWYLPAH
ncbi:MAG TPA: hypothetical protein VMT19_02040 [Thermoanaerobaculaceae bacterium]|nr:hypothetical protein [Thermoanaerobaculaceae bacterium]